MTRIGYAAMLEQFHPTELLDWCAQAEAAGFEAGFMVSEHFHPWTPQQGQSAFAWSFMGALGQRTSLRFGTAVTCPGFRYHPAVIAHAAATIGAMYPGRFYLGLGAGEALNEHVVGGVWPEIGVRSAMMFESIEIINKLFTGKVVKHRAHTSPWRAPASTPCRKARPLFTSPPPVQSTLSARAALATASSPWAQPRIRYRCSWSASRRVRSRRAKTPPRCRALSSCTSHGPRATRPQPRTR